MLRQPVRRSQFTPRATARRRFASLVAIPIAASCAFGVVASAPRAASAQDGASVAQQRFERGVALYEARAYADALVEFRRSIEAYSSPNARLYVARCLRELGRLGDAHGEMQRAVREAGDLAHSSPRYRLTEETAQVELRALDGRVGRLTVNAADVPSGARLTIDGRAVPLAALGTSIPTTPGSIVVRLEGPGIALAETSLTVRAGQSATVTLDVQRVPSAGGGDATPAPVAVRSSGFGPAPGAVLLGVGGVGLATFGVLQVLAENRWQGVRSCADASCTGALPAGIDAGRAFEAASFVALGIGGAAIITGVILLVAGRGGTERPPPVSVSIGARYFALGATF